MNRAKNINSSKTFVIIILLLAVAVIHHLPVDGFLGTHILHRELFFFPIVMAALWYGLKASLITALAASLFYTHFFYHNIDSGKISLAVIGLQVAGFNLMALLTGWMVDRHRRQQRERDCPESIWSCPSRGFRRYGTVSACIPERLWRQTLAVLNASPTPWWEMR
jgi:K+-sensing histidine kinase KdpD